jgi:hypothetical protein
MPSELIFDMAATKAALQRHREEHTVAVHVQPDVCPEGDGDPDNEDGYTEFRGDEDE